MSSGDVTEKDEGISDVIALLKNVDVSKEASQSSESQQNDNDRENIQTNNADPKSHCSNGKLKEDDDNVDKPSTTEPNSDLENATLDLSNPDQVMHMLETVDLTEEDTEILLQEAYNMNKKLKEILRRQQNTNEPTRSKSAKRRSKHAGDSQSSTSISSTKSMSNSRLGSASLKKAPLPPIEKEGTSVYAVKLHRSQTNVTDVRQIPSHSIVPRSKSTTKENTGQARKSKVKSTDPKPEWDGRFNYT